MLSAVPAVITGMDYLTLLTGAIIALGSAFLGIGSEAAKGWIVRRTTIRDKKTVFQHGTAVELQELLYELMRSSIVLHHANVDAFKKSGN